MILLLVAAVMAGLVGETNSTYIILAIIVLNAGLGLAKECPAEAAMATLKKMGVSPAAVRRADQALTVAAADLVPDNVGY